MSESRYSNPEIWDRDLRYALAHPHEPSEIDPDLIDSLNVGEAWYCAMPLESKELKEIDPTHRDRPYLILKKDKNVFYGVEATTQDKSSLPYYKKYIEVANRDKKGKVSAFNLSTIYTVPYYCITNKTTFLPSDELEAVWRQLWVVHSIDGLNHPEILPVLTPKPFDVYGKLGLWYMIYEINDKKAKAYRLGKAKKDAKGAFTLAGQPYRAVIEPKNQCTIHLDSSYQYLGFFTEEQQYFIESILRGRTEEEKQKLKNSRKLFKKSLQKYQNIFWNRYIGTIFQDAKTKNEYVYLFSRQVTKKQYHNYYYPLYIRSLNTLQDDKWKVKNYYLTWPRQIGMINQIEMERMLDKEIDLDPNLKRILKQQLYKSCF